MIVTKQRIEEVRAAFNRYPSLLRSETNDLFNYIEHLEVKLATIRSIIEETLDSLELSTRNM